MAATELDIHMQGIRCEEAKALLEQKERELWTAVDEYARRSHVYNRMLLGASPGITCAHCGATRAAHMKACRENGNVEACCSPWGC